MRASCFAAALIGSAALVPGGTVHGQAVTVMPEETFGIASGVTALAFSPDGLRLVAGGDDGGVTIHRVGQPGQSRSARPGRAAILFAGFVTGDTAFVSVDARGAIRVHPVGSPGEPGGELHTDRAPERVALDAGRRYLAVATAGSRIELFDLPTRQRIRTIDGRGDLDRVLYLGFDRLGRQLVAVTRAGRATAWNPATGQVLRRVTLQSDELHGSRTVVHGVGADRSANVLMVALEEVALPRGGLRGRARPTDLERRDRILVFDWHSGAKIRSVPFVEGQIERLAAGPGNDHATVAHGSTVTLMDLRSGETGARVTAPGRVSGLTVAVDEGRLAVGTEAGDVAVWTMAYREPVAADELREVTPALAGRLRVLGDDSPAIPRDAPATIAVLPFDDRQGDGQMARMVAEILTTQLANFDHLTLVERLRIDDLIREQDLQARGLTEADGVRLGRMLNADYVLLGSIGAFGTSQTLSARLLRVETGEVVSGRQVLCEDCRAQDLFDVIHLLGTTIAR
jgi:TolB-like protein